MNLYMHTLDEKPAYFHKGDQMIYFANDGVLDRQLFVRDLATIRRQAEISLATRNGKNLHSYFKPGYLRIKES